MQYVIRKAVGTPSLQGEWDSEVWTRANTGEVANAHPRSSNHHPQVEFRVLYTEKGLHLIYRVEDRYVRSVQTQYNGSVCGDSCVEFFVQPKAEKGYLNFEFNCGGCMLLSYIEDPKRLPDGFAKFRPVPEEDGRLVQIYHSMPAIVEPEIAEPTTWINEFFIPFALLEKYVGPLGAVEGQTWRANFYKCADKTSQPHWMTWAPIQQLNFHQPQFFAPILFEKLPEKDLSGLA